MRQKFYTERETLMKVKAVKKGYYGGVVRKIGSIFEYKEKELSSWVTLADGIENNRGSRGSKSSKAPEAQKEADKNPPVMNNSADTVQEGQQSETSKSMTDAEKQQYLELLINEGIEKNILIEDADKKTADEQITELEKALGK